MKKGLLIFLGLTIIFCLAACKGKEELETISTKAEEIDPPTTITETQPETQTTAEEPTMDYTIEFEIESAAISQNMIGQPSERTVYVNLPPSYYESEQSYPVVYFLHGYGDSSSQFANGCKNAFDTSFKDGANEFILVVLDGNSMSGGSFYVNSPVSGNWEDYVVEEVVSAIDTNFRTIPDVNSRGISGYSMGGFGALNLALKHPDVFNSVMVFGPGLFAEEDLDLVLSSWDGWVDVKRSYGQAFSPNPDLEPNYGNVITDEDIEAKNEIYNDWISGFSGWNQKVEDYLALNLPLKNISINYSGTDRFKWIPNGCINLDEILTTNSIPHEISEYMGGHIVPTDAPSGYFIPFFNTTLVYEE